MKPILFSTPMIQAILAGRKTMTRRTVKFPEGCTGWVPERPLNGKPYIYYPGGIKYPRYQPGDILWVRETFFSFKDKFYYKADGKHLELEQSGIKFKWRPSIHMPREAARIFLRVTDVSVQRINDISDYDIHAEGIPDMHDDIGERKAFRELWDGLNSKRDGGIYAWDRNPWVFVYEFKHITKEEAGEMS